MSFQVVVALPISKISSATTSAHTRPIPWEHDEGPNLQVIFERFPLTELLDSNPTEMRFRITKDREILEDLNLNDLATAVRDSRRSVYSAVPPSQNEADTSVEVIVQSPCIAMKYPTSDYHIRRFQIRFAQQHLYAQAIDMLSKSGVSLASPRQRTAPVPMPPHIAIATNREAALENSQLPHTESQCGSTPRLLQSAGTSQPFFGSHNLRIPAFQSQRSPSVDPITSLETYENGYRTRQGNLSNKSSKFPQPTLFPSSAPGSMGRTVSRDFDKFGHFPSTLPIDLTRILDAEVPPVRDLPFKSKGSRFGIGATQNEDTAHHVKEGLNIMPPRNNDQRLQSSLSSEQIRNTIARNDKNESASRVKKALTAEDIDTQNLFAKVAERVLRPKKAKPESNDQSSQSKVNVQTASQKKSTPCESCKSARTRCMKDPKNPEGACRPCLKAGKQCSRAQAQEFQEEVQTSISSRANLQQKVMVQDCPENYSKSLRVPVTLPSQSQASNRVTGSQTGWKRRSQEEMPPPPTKRSREQLGEGSPDQDASSRRSSTSLPAIRKPLSLRAKSGASINATIRSDATTATVETDDLNYKPALRIPRLTPRRQPNSDCPAFSEISDFASVHLDELISVADVQSDNEHEGTSEALDDKSTHCQTLPDLSRKSPTTDLSLSGISDLSPDAQKRLIRDFLNQALHDPKFLNLCRIIQASPAFSVLTRKI